MPFLPSPPPAFVANPAMLGWLAAASAPLIIHLLNRRKYREAPWAAMQYLLAAVKKNSKRVLLENWLLLALRTLLIVLVVVAAAEPGLRSAGLLVTATERVHRVIVIDGSFSMDYKPTGRDSYFEQARKLARRIVESGREGDGFSLVVLGTPSRTIVAEPLFRASEMLTIVDELRQPHGASDLPRCLDEIERLSADAHRRYPQIRQRHVYFLTDLGRNTWAPQRPERAEDPIEAFKARCESRLAGSTIAVIDVGAAEADNSAVVDLAAEEPYGVVGVPVRVQATVRHFGRTPRSGAVVSLKLDGRKVDEKSVDLEPGRDVAVVFDAAVEAPREPTARVYEASLAPDRLELDDRRTMVLPVKPQLRVLVVRDVAADDDQRFALELLGDSLELKPGTEGLAVSPIRVAVETDDVLQSGDLSEYDCVFLVDVRRFTPAAVRILHAYLRGGGGLVWWLGPRADIKHYDELLASGAHRLLPARIGPLVAEPQYKLNPLKYEHPLVAELRADDRINLLNAPVYRYFRLDPSPFPAAQRVIEFLNAAKDPLLTAETIGLGRTTLFATGLEASWNAMPVVSPGFVILVQELLSYGAGARNSLRQALVGELLSGTYRRAEAEPNVGVAAPGDAAASPGAATPADVVPDGDAYRWTFADTRRAGLYEVRPATRSPIAERYAVNVDPRESDLQKLPPQQLTGQTWTGVRFAYATELQDFSEPVETFVAAGDADPIHRWLLMAALGAAIGETWFAGRIGRRRL